VPTSEHPEAGRDEIERALVDHREQHYASLEGFLPPELDRYPVELRVVVGNPFERIVETAIHDDVGLIIMGTHGRTGLSRLAAGSVAERVVRMAPCPVLTVKATIPDTENWLKEFYQTFLPAKT